MFSPLIRSDSKSGGGVVPDVKITGEDTAPGSADRIAEQPNDAINKAAATVRASNTTVTPHVSPYYLHIAR
jgi:hypothetical protein